MRTFTPKCLLGLFSVGTLVLGACGSDDTAATALPSTVAATDATSAPSSPPAASADVTTPPAATAAATTEPAPVTSGSVPAPVPAERIVALDETAALNLLTLGIEPTIVLTSLSSDMFVPIADALDLATEPFMIAEPSMEFLAGLEPDRIVALGNPFVTGRLGEYEAIAPVTVVPVDGTWEEQVTALAADFDVEDRARDVIAAVDTSIEELADAVTDDDIGASISVVTARGDMTIAATGNSPAGDVLTAAGFTRPAPQAASGTGLPFTPLTLETLGDHDADVLMLPSGSLFATEAITSSPLYPRLGAVTSGRVYEVAAEPWVVGGSAFAAWWIASDLARVFLDGEVPAAPTDAALRWQEFIALTG